MQDNHNYNPPERFDQHWLDEEDDDDRLPVGVMLLCIIIGGAIFWTVLVTWLVYTYL